MWPQCGLSPGAMLPVSPSSLHAPRIKQQSYTDDAHRSVEGPEMFVADSDSFLFSIVPAMRSLWDTMSEQFGTRH